MRWYIISKKTFYRTRVALSVVLIAALLVLFSVSVIGARYDGALAVNTAPLVDEGKLVVIDAGHGGEDCGAVGADGKYEKDLNMEIAAEIGALLTERGYTVIYTRTEDKLLYT